MKTSVSLINKIKEAIPLSDRLLYKPYSKNKIAVIAYLIIYPKIPSVS